MRQQAGRSNCRVSVSEGTNAAVRRLAVKWCSEPSVRGGKRRPWNTKLVTWTLLKHELSSQENLYCKLTSYIKEEEDFET